MKRKSFSVMMMLVLTIAEPGIGTFKYKYAVVVK